MFKPKYDFYICSKMYSFMNIIICCFHHKCEFMLSKYVESVPRFSVIACLDLYESLLVWICMSHCLSGFV